MSDNGSLDAIRNYLLQQPDPLGALDELLGVQSPQRDPVTSAFMNTPREERPPVNARIGQAPGAVEEFLARGQALGNLTRKPELSYTPTEQQMAGEIPSYMLDLMDLPGTAARTVSKDLGATDTQAMIAEFLAGGMGPDDIAQMTSKAISPGLLLGVLENRPSTRLLHGTSTEAAEEILKTGNFKQFSQPEQVARGLERAGITPERFKSWPDNIKDQIFKTGFIAPSGGGARSDVFLTPKRSGSFSAEKFARMGGETSEFVRQRAALVAKAEELGFDLHDVARIADDINVGPIGLLEDRITKALGFEDAFQVIKRDPSEVGTVMAVDVPKGINPDLDTAMESVLSDARQAIDTGEIKTTDELQSFIRGSLGLEFAVPPGAATPVRKQKFQSGGMVNPTYNWIMEYINQ